MVVEPLNLTGGAGSPANAAALRWSTPPWRARGGHPTLDVRRVGRYSAAISLNVAASVCTTNLETSRGRTRGRQHPAEGPGSVVDLSTNRTTSELTGPRALAVPQKGYPLDPHPRPFALGAAYITGLGSVPVDAMVQFKAPELS